MSMNWNDIGTSVIVSLIVSTSTFIFGLKAGKNQSDRPSLKELYRSLYSHFLKLFTDLNSEIPPKWSDYKKINTHNGYRYVPQIEELYNDGKLIELGEKYSNKLLELERQILVTSSQQYNSYKEIEAFIVTYLENRIGERLIKEQYSYTTSKNTVGKHLISTRYSVFFNDSVFCEINKRLKSNRLLSLQFTYSTEGSKTHPINLYISDNGNNDEIIDILGDVYLKVQNLDYVKKIILEKKQIIKLKDKTLKKLSRKSKNPHSFIQTIIGAITDIFIC